MASNKFRTTHIPLTVTRVQGVDTIIPNRALSLMALEHKNMDDYLTIFEMDYVRESEQYSAPTLAMRLYAEPKYEWLICWYNGIIQPTIQLHAGLRIKVPDINQVEGYLSQTNRTKGVGYVYR